MDGPARHPQYGFVIDQRKCIGCHACTVACKAENEVPLGKFRTWVKYVDKGTFPSVRRHFTVLRCNHCDAAPCVEICPVNALHKRKDAIVDLDKDVCIGCRACMQACPYDAIYLNDDTGTAEKCHYCAHRTELGLEPACVVVCPERAIVAGDVSDPASGISQMINSLPTSRRKVEKGTKPRVWYVDALPEALTPGETTEPSQWLWADRQVQPPAIPEELKPPEDVVTTLNAEHPPVWGWHIWTYLVTKNIAAGAGIVAPFLAMLGVAAGGARDYVPEIVALVFLGVTLFLLVHDLGRPERFWRVMFAPNTKSWLVKGGWILNGFGAVTTAVLVARWLGYDSTADALRWVNVPVAVMTSGYSAFLFAQCRGRDLWQSKLLFPNLIVEAIACGAAMSVLLTGVMGAAHIVFTLSSVLVLALTMWEWREHGHAQYVQWIEQAGAVRKGSLYVFAGGLAFMARQSALSPGHPVRDALPAVAGLIWFLLLRARGWVVAGQAVPI
jgi:Fe-S-cluster-containing dehydrogenase component/formate-dependent nitrite reductase membrane component NrfD